MADTDAHDPQGGSTDAADRPQDPIVERGRPAPGHPPPEHVTMFGFLGDSERPGFRRLYFNRDLDYYAEFPVADVVHVASISADALPFLGDEATRVTLSRDTTIEYARSRSARPLDEFDLDVQLDGRLAKDRRYAAAGGCTSVFLSTCEPITTPHTSCAFCP